MTLRRSFPFAIWQSCTVFILPSTAPSTTLTTLLLQCTPYLIHALSQPYSSPPLSIPYYPIHVKFHNSTAISTSEYHKRIARYLSSVPLPLQAPSRAFSGTKSTVSGEPLRRRRPPGHLSACWDPEPIYDLCAQCPESFCSYAPVSLLTRVSRGLACG